MLTVYYNENSPNCFKIRVLLNELGVEYEPVRTAFTDLASPDLAEKFPLGKLPAIDDDGVCLSESSAISFYLSEKHKSALIPEDKQSYALMLQAMALESSSILPVIGGNGIFGEKNKPEDKRDQSFIDRLMPQAQKIGQQLNRLLEGKEYFANIFTIADIQIFAPIYKAVKFNVIENPASNLVDWVNRISERESVTKAAEVFAQYQR